jgi:hypothetical protein
MLRVFNADEHIVTRTIASTSDAAPSLTRSALTP